jgi:drug/metabolite transporter (DMT)-like permease
LASLKEKWKTYNATLGLFIATLAWGASFFLVKKATSQIGVWPFLFWRFGFSSLLMVIIFPLKFLRAKAHTIKHGFLVGALLAFTIMTQTFGLQMTSAGKSGFLTSLYVPLVPILGWVFKKPNITHRHFLVAFISAFGLYILTDTAASHSVTEWWREVNPGDLWTLAAALFAALHILYTEHITQKESDSIALGLWQFIGCFSFIFLATLTQKSPEPFVPLEWNPLRWPSFALGSLLFNAIFSTCFGFITQIVCQKYLGALKAALIFALEAPFATGFAFLFMNEILTPKEFIGAAIVFLVSIVPDSWLKAK